MVFYLQVLKKCFSDVLQINHRILAAQLTGLFIEVESAKFSHHLSVILPIIQQQIDPGRYSDNVCCIKIACFTLSYHNLHVKVCPSINSIYTLFTCILDVHVCPPIFRTVHINILTSFLFAYLHLKTFCLVL